MYTQLNIPDSQSTCKYLNINLIYEYYNEY